MRNIYAQFAKAAVILVISLSLLWLSEEFSPGNLFEPNGTGWVLWVSYARNLILPFVLYFLICLSERWLTTWQSRALFAFAIPTLIEVGQNLYYRFPADRYVGSFDPLDIVMHAIAVGLAVLLEQQVFAKLLKFWNRGRLFAADLA